MKKFSELLNETKVQLKALLTADSSKEEIEKITALDKALDDLNLSHEETEKDVATYKEMVINQVKNTGFKGPAKDDTGADTEKTPSLEEVLDSELKKLNQNKDNKEE